MTQILTSIVTSMTPIFPPNDLKVDLETRLKEAIHRDPELTCHGLRSGFLFEQVILKK